MTLRSTTRAIFIFSLFLILTAACTPVPAPMAEPEPATPTTAPSPTTTPTGAPSVRSEGVLFSELVPGVPGNNNHEFIELYNAGQAAVDVRGWSIWYRLNDSQDAQRVYRWSQTTDIPGYGHLLLVREGADLDVMPDGTFDVPLFERWGGLQLRNAQDEVVDTLGWGTAPEGFVDDVPAPTPTDGASLERKPGDDGGNGVDTDDSAADFVLRADPLPQNSGMAITPLPEKRLSISAATVEAVTPGTEFEVVVTVQNLTGEDLTDLAVHMPLPDGVQLRAIDGKPVIESEASESASTVAEWRIPMLDVGARSQTWLTARSPWQYGTVYLKSYGVATGDWPMAAYGPLVPVTVAGGAIPIETARTLEGEMVTVEGVATMYTGGFYAGSTGTKFYVEDETGGIQVYCPGGKGEVAVRIGDRVRVSGGIEVYRDSLELVPEAYPDDVEVLDNDASDPLPQSVALGDVARREEVIGRLVEVEGTIARFEEFSYSYELDLLGPKGDQVLVYIEKDTRMVPEFLAVGDTYRVAGIAEVYDGQRQIKPRVIEDFDRVYPPELMLGVMARNSVAPGGIVTYTLTAVNHTPEPLTNVVITATPPLEAATVLGTSGDPSLLADGAIAWVLPELPAEGGTGVVTYTVQAASDIVEGSFEASATATADTWPTPVTPEPWRTFVGSGVPIWAIQGDGARSPFALSEATTEGVVTGIFPEQNGFWIQSLEPDNDPLTSEGLFVETGALSLQSLFPEWEPSGVLTEPVGAGVLTEPVGSGVLTEPVGSGVLTEPVGAGVLTEPLTYRVTVRGKVRERSGQTLLQVTDADAIQVVSGTFELPVPVSLAPPQDDTASRAYHEPLEGMLVALAEPAVAVGPTSRYGETPLVLQGWGIDRVMKGEPKGMLIFADDGFSATHPDRTTLAYALKTGDIITGLVGPLAYTYDNYKIQPVVTPTVISQAVALPTVAPAGPDAFSIATFNVENLFDVLDPHPSSPPKPGIRDYVTRIEKAAATLVSMGAPTIVGLQEVENIGILADIVEHELVAGYGYIPVLVEGFDSRGIDVGYLVRGDLATVDGISQHEAPEGLTSRPPLMITVTVRLDGGDQTVVVLNNHFTSMSGGELATEPRRVAQAEWNADLVEQLLAADPDAYVVVLGDLNSFYDSPPLDVLRDTGLQHVYDSLPFGATPYTYIYQGESETLDHILVTPGLYAQLTRVEALHVNADFPPSQPGDTSPERLSDHDPLIAVFGDE